MRAWVRVRRQPANDRQVKAKGVHEPVDARPALVRQHVHQRRTNVLGSRLQRIRLEDLSAVRNAQGTLLHGSIRRDARHGDRPFRTQKTIKKPNQTKPLVLRLCTRARKPKQKSE